MEYLGWYFIIGLVVLVFFDALTGRIRKNLPNASRDAQIKMAEQGQMTGGKTSFLVTLIFMWMFWPLVPAGALSSWIGKKIKRGKNG